MWSTTPGRMAPDTVFETRRLRCRRWRPTDLAPLFAVYSDVEGARWVGDGQPITLADCEAWLRVTDNNYQRRGYGMFALEDRASGEVIGFCGLVHPGGQVDAEIKYSFLRSHWGRGFASEVVPALLACGAERHGLAKIIATVALGNLASQRVLAKAGMLRTALRDNEDGSQTVVFEWCPPPDVDMGDDVC